MKIINIPVLLYFLRNVYAFWDLGTTTPYPHWRIDELTIRKSRFRWMRSEKWIFKIFCPWWDWPNLEFRRRLYCVAGVTYGMINLSTATILNRRTVITAANHLEPYLNDAKNVRVWALGWEGDFDTPYRYRVWRITRILPRSMNPEHQHGPWGYHSPRHDISIIHTLDQMYIYTGSPGGNAYASRAILVSGMRHKLTKSGIWYSGCGYEYHKHVIENYKIFFSKTTRDHVKDCSKYVPKWWGKFICIFNDIRFPCVQNGAPLFDQRLQIGVGCFEMRVNDDSYLVFTDIRFYVDLIHDLADIKPGEYYEYAYPQWLYKRPELPSKNIKKDLYPLG